MHLSLTQIVDALLHEAFAYRRAVVAIFVAVSFLGVGLGLSWPSKFTASTTIIVDEKNIIEPLMKGAAVATEVTDRAKLAKEVIFSRRLMAKVIERAGWAPGQTLTPKEEESVITKILIPNTKISNIDKSLIKIEYSDGNSERAFVTAREIADLFISESLAAKAKESQDAYDFINAQTEEYHEKLVKAEAQLKDFRSANLDAQPGSEGTVGTRINTLEEKIQQTVNEINEAETKRASLEKQLSGEAEVTAAFTHEGQYRTRIAELQQQLDTLRLSYQDTYPDIVRIKHQIEDMNEAINNDRREREAGKGKPHALSEETMAANPLFQELRRELSQTKTQIDTLQARLVDARRLLTNETTRGKRVHDSEAALAELTRDYQVNRDLYQDLLKRRESARVSMNMDIANQGLTFKIHEPATMPLAPSGPRFLHFFLGGIVLGLAIPFGLLYLKLQLDPRLRFESIISDKLKMPVLAVIPHLSNSAEERAAAGSLRTLLLVVAANFGILAGIAAMRVGGYL
jgi:polysaccharide chain length determinant protein (PEP-CTERM system associated)